MPLVSIITPTRDRPDTLARLLASIQKQTYPAIETLIVDDGSAPALSLPGEPVRIIRNPSSLGFCRANNVGFAEAKGDFLLLVNDDAELADENVVERAVKLALAYPGAGAIAFAQLLPSRVPHSLQPADTSRLSYVAQFLGYGCLLRRNVVDRIGGFNPTFGAYHEDLEMSLRIMQAGSTVLYEPRLQVIHHEDARHRNYQRIHRLAFKNALLTALLRYPWYCVPPAAVSYFVNFLRMTRNHKGFDPGGILWAGFEVCRHWRHVWRERRAMPIGVFLHIRRLRAHPMPLEGAPPANANSASLGGK